MALDPSIALRAGNRQRRDPSREYANALAIKQAQGQIEAQKADRARTEAVRNALAGATKPDGSVDYGVVRNVLLQHGDVSGAMGVDKTQADMATSQTTSELKNLELAREKIGMAASLLGSARDEQTYQAALQRAGQMGLPVEGAPAQFDPEWVQQTLQQTLTAKEQLDAAFQERKFAETQRHNRSTEGAAWVRANRPDTVVNLSPEDKFKNERALRAEATKASQNFMDVRDAIGRIKAALPSATTSAAATLTAATSFMKLLDPGSVVRESELGMALAATGVLDRAANYFNRLKNGNVLTPSQARDFESIVGKVYEAAETEQRKRMSEYEQDAKAYGLDPKRVLRGLYASTANNEEKPGSPPAGAIPGPNAKAREELDQFRRRYKVPGY